jgi:hypothetical protein
MGSCFIPMAESIKANGRTTPNKVMGIKNFQTLLAMMAHI